MRFTNRQICFILVLALYWLGLFRFADFSHTSTLAVLMGVTLYLSDRMIREWHGLQRREVGFFAIALCASIAGAFVGIGDIAQHVSQSTEHSQQLQADIREDPRFANVVAKYYGGSASPVLTLSGQVATENDLVALKAMANENFWYFKTTVRWRVRIVPSKRPDQTP